MFERTIKSHPILGKLAARISILDGQKSFIGIRERDLVAGKDGTYIINEEIMITLILNASENNDDEALQFLTDKKALHELQTLNKDHSFYLKFNAFQNEDFIKLSIQKKFYDAMLKALFQIATYPEYFEFSATSLLYYAVEEQQVAYNVKALHFFIDLFRNAGVKTKTGLKERQKVLEKLMKKAKDEKNNEALYVLMRTLGVAADVFESGEYSSLEDVQPEDAHFLSYIHFAVDVLMAHSGLKDKYGLDVTAEEMLNNILDSSITEYNICGTIDIPFRIYKQYLASEKVWNQQPFFHIAKLADYIETCKKNGDCDQDELSGLEHRFEQLKSLVEVDSAFISDDLVMYRGAKNPAKVCTINLGVDQETGLQLHERQSLAERLIFSGSTCLEDIDRVYPKTTYLIANFGLLITDIPHTKGGKHSRIRLSMPISIEDQTITGSGYRAGGHAEVVFYAHFLKDENILAIVRNFLKKFNLKEAGHKVYSVVFDLHGTYDMCESCNDSGKNFQNQFREKLLKLLPLLNLKGPTKCPEQLPIVINYSSDCLYHFDQIEHVDNPEKHGVPTIVRKQYGEKRNLKPVDKEQKLQYESNRDIQHFGKNLLVHGGPSWHLLWDRKKEQFANKKLPLETWTAFTTDFNFMKMEERRKKTPYLVGGRVITETAATTAADTKGQKAPAKRVVFE